MSKILLALFISISIIASSTLFAIHKPSKIGGEILATGTAKVEIDSNVFVDSNEKEDVVFYATPGLAYKKEDSLVNVDASIEVETKRYVDNDNSDSEDIRTSINVSYPNMEKRELYMESSLSWRQQSSATSDDPNNAITETEVSELRVKIMKDLIKLYSAYVQLELKDSDELNAGNIDRFESTVTGTINYLYSENLTLNASIRYRNTDFASGPNDSDDIATYIGAEGKLGPKVNGILNVGGQVRESQQTGSDIEPFIEAVIKYIINDDRNITATLKSDFSSTPGSSSKNEKLVRLQYNHKISPKMKFNIGSQYKFSQFTGSTNRDDDNMEIYSGIKYTFTDYVDAFTRLVITRNQSTLESSDYDRNRFELGVNAKY